MANVSSCVSTSFSFLHNKSTAQCVPLGQASHIRSLSEAYQLFLVREVCPDSNACYQGCVKHITQCHSCTLCVARHFNMGLEHCVSVKVVHSIEGNSSVTDKQCYGHRKTFFYLFFCYRKTFASNCVKFEWWPTGNWLSNLKPFSGYIYLKWRQHILLCLLCIYMTSFTYTFRTKLFSIHYLCIWVFYMSSEIVSAVTSC